VNDKKGYEKDFYKKLLEYHVEGNCQKAGTEDFPQDYFGKTDGEFSADKPAEHKSQTEKSGHGQIDMSLFVIGQGGEDADRGDQHGESGSLRHVLGIAEKIHQRRHYEYAAAYPYHPAENARNQTH